MANNYLLRVMANKEKCLFDIIYEGIPNSVMAYLMTTPLCDLPPYSKISTEDAESFANEIAKHLNFPEPSLATSEQKEIVGQLAVFMVLYLDLVQTRMLAGFDTKGFKQMMRMTKYMNLKYLRHSTDGVIRLFPKDKPQCKYNLEFYLDTMTLNIAGLFDKKKVDNGDFIRYSGNLKELPIYDLENFLAWMQMSDVGSTIKEFVDDVEPAIYCIY